MSIKSEHYFQSSFLIIVTILHIFLYTHAITYGQANHITLTCSLCNRFLLYHHPMLAVVVCVLVTSLL